MDPSVNHEGQAVEQDLIDLVDRFLSTVVPVGPASENGLTLVRDPDAAYSSDDEIDPDRLLDYTELGADEDSSVEWLELSEYAKVIFWDLYHDTESGSVGCKFQITDSVHEDPCDFVGLIRVGFEDVSQCIVSKMLSQTNCEENGKVLSCDFLAAELPAIEAGYYQFLYITCDSDICGASTPFKIAQTRAKSASPDITTERGDDDFLVVRHGLEKKNQMLEELLAESQEKNREQDAILTELRLEKEDTLRENKVVIESLQKAIEALKDELGTKVKALSESTSALNALSERVPALEREITVKENLLCEKDAMMKQLSLTNCSLQERANEAYALRRDNNGLLAEIQRLRTTCVQSFDQNRMELILQIDDQKYMIQALEDSKQLALREMSSLSETLSKRSIAINQLKIELNFCKEKIKELTEALDKRTLELQDTSVELAAYKIIKETPPTEKQHEEEMQKLNEELYNTQEKLKKSIELESKQTEKLQKMTSKFRECQIRLHNCFGAMKGKDEDMADLNEELEESKEKLKQCGVSETKQAELEKVTAELAECEEQQLRAQEIILMLTRKVEQLQSDLGYYQCQAEKFIDSKKVDSTLLSERMSLIQTAVKKCEELCKDMDKSLTMPPYPSSTQESCRRKCQTLAFKGKVTDVKICLDKAESIGQDQDAAAVPVKKVDRKKYLKCWECVSSEDGAFIRELNKKIKQRDWSLLEVAGNPDSDFYVKVRNSSQNLDRILQAVKCQFFSIHSWPEFVEGYNGEYAELPQDIQMEMILGEIRSQYEIQILLDEACRLEKRLVKGTVSEEEYSAAKKEIRDLGKFLKEVQDDKWKEHNLLTQAQKESSELKKNCTELESVAANKEAEVSKLTDKLCDINSKCMLLEEELQDLRNQYGELKSSLKESQDAHAHVKDECMKKDALIEFIQNEKGDLSSIQMQLQDTVKDHTARLTEAAELYKKQFKEIEKLKKKLKKIKREPHQIPTPSETSDPPVVVLNDESKTSSPVHEIFYPARSSSDSDTGEHVSGDSTLKDEKEKPSKATKTPRQEQIDEKAKAFFTILRKYGIESALTTESVTSYHVSDHIIQRFLNKRSQQSKLPQPIITIPATSSEEELYPIPCPICNQTITVSAKSTEPLTGHMEMDHRVSMCPICGHLFEESVPKKYLSYHIEKHFQKEGEEKEGEEKQKTCD